MKVMIGFVSLALVLASSAPADDEIPEALQESVREEIRGIADSIRILGRTANELSPGMEEEYQKAKRLAGESREQAKKGRLRQAYRTLREAKHAVTPVVAATLERNDVPQDVKDLVSAEVSMTAGRIEILAGLLTDRAPPEATAAYREAKDLYRDAKALHEEGKDADAIRTLDECLSRLDVAIRATFQPEK